MLAVVRRPVPVVPTGEREMTTVRQTVLSVVVLAAFMLVLAAPFRWW
jgi:hypothetical protein